MKFDTHMRSSRTCSDLLTRGLVFPDQPPGTAVSPADGSTRIPIVSGRVPPRPESFLQIQRKGAEKDKRILSAPLRLGVVKNIGNYFGFRNAFSFLTSAILPLMALVVEASPLTRVRARS